MSFCVVWDGRCGNFQDESLSPGPPFCFSLANSDLFCVVCQIAEKEAAKGSTGSGKLRKDALSALRTLLLKVQFCVQILLSACS